MTTELRGDFNYPCAYRIGAGRVDELPGACAALGMARPLVVSDPGVAGLDWFPGVVDALAGAGLEARVFERVGPNPTSADVEAGLEALAEHRADGCVLIGGGSALDVGKCLALLARNPGTLFDYVDEGERWKRADGDRILPTIAVPTTAGTGSEVGRAAVIVDPESREKRIIFHPRMQPDLVLADPLLTLGLPPGITAATGMDALAHGFEAYCAPAYHPMADGIALECVRLVDENLVTAFEHGGDVSARTHMLMAASMGATAFQKGLGLIHALSHPLGGVTGFHHGTANAVFLPYVMVHNRAAIEERMVRLARHLGLEEPSFEAVLEWSLALRARLGLPHTLEGVIDERLAERLAPMAAADPSLATNPIPCSVEELETVFLKALRGDLGR